MRNGTDRYNKYGFDDNFSLEATQAGGVNSGATNNDIP